MNRLIDGRYNNPMHTMEITNSRALPRAVAVVVAAGRSERFGAPKKQFVDVRGIPLVALTMQMLEKSPLISGIVLVVPDDDVNYAKREVVPRSGCTRVIDVVPGGADRQASVRHGLSAVPRDAEWVLVHDGVRPVVSPGLIERVIAGAQATGAAIPALPVYETLKESLEDGFVARTVDRRGLWRVQTPQAFRRDLLESAHALAVRKNLQATDDACVVEAAGAKVTLVMGDEANIKVTTPGDFRVVEGIILRDESSAVLRQAPRVGMGYDIHRIVAGDGIVLGGVRIPCEFSLEGHSDADVLCHAVMDAVLGAIGERDIGCQFPDTDPQYRGAYSKDLLERVAGMASSRGFRLVNADTVVVAERPRLSEHIPAIRESIASALNASPADVAVKATTSEGIGFVGRGEGICAWAVVTIERIGGAGSCL